MVQINENYQKLPGSYLFADIARRTAAYQEAHPDAKLIRMGIGDVTRPLAPAVVEAMHKAVDRPGRRRRPSTATAPSRATTSCATPSSSATSRRAAWISKPDEVFISDGAKSDCGNIGDLFGADNVVAVCDPVYPVYVDTNAMAGRAGDYDEQAQGWNEARLHAHHGRQRLLPGPARGARGHHLPVLAEQPHRHRPHLRPAEGMGRLRQQPRGGHHVRRRLRALHRRGRCAPFHLRDSRRQGMRHRVPLVLEDRRLHRGPLRLHRGAEKPSCAGARACATCGTDARRRSSTAPAT